MNRISKARLLPAVALLFSLLSMIAGLLLVLCLAQPRVALQLVSFARVYWPPFLLLGIGLLTLSGATLWYLTSLPGDRHYYISVANDMTTIDRKVIESTLSHFWRSNKYPDSLHSEVHLRNNKLTVNASLSGKGLAVAEQRLLVERMKGELKHLLAQNFGYHRRLRLSVNFEEPNSSPTP